MMVMAHVFRVEAFIFCECVYRFWCLNTRSIFPPQNRYIQVKYVSGVHDTICFPRCKNHVGVVIPSCWLTSTFVGDASSSLCDVWAEREKNITTRFCAARVINMHTWIVVVAWCHSPSLLYINSRLLVRITIYFYMAVPSMQMHYVYAHLAPIMYMNIKYTVKYTICMPNVVLTRGANKWELIPETRGVFRRDDFNRIYLCKRKFHLHNRAFVWPYVLSAYAAYLNMYMVCMRVCVSNELRVMP